MFILSKNIIRLLITFLILSSYLIVFADTPKLGPNGEIYLTYNSGDKYDQTLFYVTDRHGFRLSQIKCDDQGNYSYNKLVNGEWVKEPIIVFFDSDGEPYVKQFPTYPNTQEEIFYDDLAKVSQNCKSQDFNKMKVGEIKTLMDKYRTDEEKLDLILYEIIYSTPGNSYSYITDEIRDARIGLVRYAFDSNMFTDLPEEFVYKVSWGYSSDEKMIEEVLRNIPHNLLNIETTQRVYNCDLNNFNIYLERDDLTAENLNATLDFFLKSLVRLFHYTNAKSSYTDMMQQVKKLELLINDPRFDISTLYNLFNSAGECEKHFAAGVVAWGKEISNPCEILHELYRETPEELSEIIKRKFSEHEKKLESEGLFKESTDDSTPLMSAVSQNDLEKVKKLLAECPRGAIVELINNHANRCSVILFFEETVSGFSDLKGQKCADMDYQESKFGNSALIIAVENGNSPIAEILLSYGANVHLKTKFNKMALEIAAKKNDLDSVSQLLKAGASDFANAIQAAEDGKTLATAIEDLDTRRDIQSQYKRIVELINKYETLWIKNKTEELMNLIEMPQQYLPTLIVLP